MPADTLWALRAACRRIPERHRDWRAVLGHEAIPIFGYELERAAESSVDAPDPTSLDDRSRDSLIAVLERQATPEQVLMAISALFPDRLAMPCTALLTDSRRSLRDRLHRRRYK